MNDSARTPIVKSYKRSWASLALIVAVTAIVVSIPVFAVGYVLGYIHARAERGNNDVRIVNRITAENPDSYSSLTINRGPLDKFHLEGTVQTEEALDSLKAQMIRSFGEDRAEYILEVTVDGALGG